MLKQAKSHTGGGAASLAHCPVSDKKKKKVRILKVYTEFERPVAVHSPTNSKHCQRSVHEEKIKTQSFLPICCDRFPLSSQTWQKRSESCFNKFCKKYAPGPQFGGHFDEKRYLCASACAIELHGGESAVADLRAVGVWRGLGQMLNAVTGAVSAEVDCSVVFFPLDCARDSIS